MQVQRQPPQNIHSNVDPEQAAEQQVERRARKQMKPNKGASIIKEERGEYNIWFNKYQGERSQSSDVVKAETRCIPELDTGRTRAKPGSYFCLHFARGRCIKGHECSFLHKIPTEEDQFDLTYDCFGREKFREERDDRSGIGSFERDNRTLYIGRIHIATKTEDIVYKHFSAWGPIESIRILSSKGVAFVKYKYRSSAEMAKEAMYGQSMDNGEIINIRWANDDPNPGVVEDTKRKYEKVVAEAVAKTLPVLGDGGTYIDYEQGFQYQPNAAKQQKTQDSSSQYANDASGFFKYYKDCAEYYKSQGDAETAEQYSQYAEYYSPENQRILAENGVVSAGRSVSNPVVQQSVPEEVVRANTVEKIGARDEEKLGVTVKKNALSLVADYGSDSD